MANLKQKKKMMIIHLLKKLPSMNKINSVGIITAIRTDINS